MPTNWLPRVYRSGDSGAPVMSGTAGALLGVLDVLVNGYGSVTVNSLVVSSDQATATVSAGHQFDEIDDIGPVVRISGANPPALNVDARITIDSPTQFSFAAPGIPDQTATGTITAKRAPADYAWQYTETNKKVLARTVIESTAMVLRVDDTPTQFPTLIMYESMSDVDTGVGPAPLSGSLWFGKSTASSSLARDWVLYADPLAFYLFVKNDGTWMRGQMYFGDGLPLYPADAYHCGLIGHSSAFYAAGQLETLNSSSGAWLSKDKSQSGAAIAMQRKSHGIAGNSLGSAGASYIDGADPFLCSQITAWNSLGSNLRMIMPGFYCPLHAFSVFSGYQVIKNIQNMPGSALMMQPIQVSTGGAFEIKNPWRSL